MDGNPSLVTILLSNLVRPLSACHQATFLSKINMVVNTKTDQIKKRINGNATMMMHTKFELVLIRRGLTVTIFSHVDPS